MVPWARNFAPTVILTRPHRRTGVRCVFFLGSRSHLACPAPVGVLARMSAIMEEVSKKPLGAHVKNLVFEICCDDADGEEVEVPYICYSRGAK